MEAAQPQLPASLTSSPNGPLRPSFSDALRFWEFRRIFYNLALAVASFGWVVATWPHFRPALTMHSLLLFSVLFAFLLANYWIADEIYPDFR
jgi:hypothetical protein